MRHRRGNIIGQWLSRAIFTLARGIGVVWGHLMFTGHGNARRITRLNLGLAYQDLGSRQLHRLTRASLRESGQLLFELMLFWFAPAAVFTHAVREVCGEQLIRQAQQAGKGVIVITPHLGNWEIFNIPFAHLSMAGLYKPVASPRLDRWVRYGRERHGGRLFPLNAGGIRRLRRHLNSQGLVVALPDQVPARQAGRVKVPFFGVPAWTGTLLPRLIRHCNVEVIMGCAWRLPGGRGFKVELEPAPDAVYAEAPEQAAAAINSAMERLIRRCPQQYLWEYKRFKHSLYPGLYDRSCPYRYRRR